MDEVTGPGRLVANDTVAVVSTSWDGLHHIPHRYHAGLGVLREE